MTNQQIIAINNPCMFPEECSNQRYREIFSCGFYKLSTILTVNIGDE